MEKTPGKESTAEEMGIAPDDVEFTREELKRLAQQAADLAHESEIEGEPGSAQVFCGTSRRALQLLARKMNQPKGNPKNN
jgi:hypothetical protein